MPAPPPAVDCQPGSSVANWVFGIPIKLVAAEAGFLPPGPLTLLADMTQEELGGVS